MIEQFKNLIADFHERKLPQDIVSRDLPLPETAGKIQSIIGPRRAGKTWFLYSLIQTERQSGVDSRRQLYINFEDERFQFNAQSFQQILDAYQQLYPDIALNDVSFYFDEIQVVPGWERFLRRLQDTIASKIYVTGSSAKLLSREIATQLRGRTLSSTLLPFSFRERLRHADIDTENIYSTANRNRIASLFEEYLHRGGYPEILDVDRESFIRILQEYGDVLLYRDILERHDLHNPHVVREFMLRLIANNSKLISVNKFYNDFRSRGLRTSKDTLYSLLDHFEDAYAILTLKKYDPSISRREQSQNKVFVNDPGYATAYRPTFSEDAGQKLETVIFLELSRRRQEVFYFNRDNSECDFVVTKQGEPVNLIQVCYALNEENRNREIKGMEAAMRVTGRKSGLLLTNNQEERIETAAGEIQVLPAWRWLLE